MLVDLHTHTYPASDCSHIAYRDSSPAALNGVQAIALTNHGDVTDNLRSGSGRWRQRACC